MKNHRVSVEETEVSSSSIPTITSPCLDTSLRRNDGSLIFSLGFNQCFSVKVFILKKHYD